VNSSFTLYNWQWATPLTAPRTLTINAGETVTKAAGGTFNLDGTAANPVSFAGTGTISPAITVYYCGSSTVAGIDCQPGGPPSPGYGSSPAIGSTLNISGAVGTNPSTTLTVSETGDATLTFISSQLANPVPAKFSMTPNIPSPIVNGGAAQTVTITCNGSVAGTFTATLKLSHDDPSITSPATYPISCVIGGGGGGSGTPISASVESDLAFVLTFLGIMLFAAFKMRKNKA